jgi:type II restriction/modification system DNA methylase subunit YeeA
MFAEDVNLLPEKMFERMIKASRPKPETFAEQAGRLFTAMRTGGYVGFEPVEWFNGGLFDTDEALPLTWEDLDDLIRATQLDWSDIDPSILGTLFERGLDPEKRSQLGAHYTDRDKIMQIVQPVLVQPLLAEWAAIRDEMAALIEAAPMATKDKLLVGAELAARTRAFKRAEELRQGFLDRLQNYRVLDPACGSGNFLYIALTELKNIEHRANLEAEALGLQRPALQVVGPENVLGIELNPYAAELARVSVWIGEIQWMRRNGFEAARNPILRTLTNIENRDAVLNPDGTRAGWPKADAVVGNPPFLGNKRMIKALGEQYSLALRRAWDNVPGGADLVCFWFAKAWGQIQAGLLTRAGLVATNSIRDGANREILKHIVSGGRVFDAWSDEAWTVDGADVRVSMVCFDGETHGAARLNGQVVSKIYSNLAALNDDLTATKALLSNLNRAFQGPVAVGPFDPPLELAKSMLLAPINPNGRSNSDVLRPWLNAVDVVRRPSKKWIVDFGEMELAEAALYEAPFEYVAREVKPERELNRDRQRREKWWRLGRSGAAMRKALLGLSRFIATPETSKYRLFVWLPAGTLPSHKLYAIARDDDTSFGLLCSKFHEVWSITLGSMHGVGNDPRYTTSTTFDTFPFPEGLAPNIPATAYAADPRAQRIAIAAARLNELRENWLNPSDLVDRVPEVVPGYPDRMLPKNDAAAAELKKRTLTKLYNTRPAWLDHAHRALDEAVAEAYGWGDDWRANKLTDDEILARLFRLNQERSTKGEVK